MGTSGSTDVVGFCRHHLARSVPLHVHGRVQPLRRQVLMSSRFANKWLAGETEPSFYNREYVSMVLDVRVCDSARTHLDYLPCTYSA